MIFNINIIKVKLFISKYVFLFILCFVPFSLLYNPLPAMGITYYVDKDASGNNSGSSWSNAWRSFSQIDWSRIVAGDTIHISGGTSSKTYSESLVIGKSGSSGVPITVQKANDSGHNGEVIIDGKNTLQALIVLENRQYVNISNLTLKDTATSEGGRGVDIDECSFITVENTKILVSGRAGIFIEESQDCILRNNMIETYAYVAYQTDGIYSQRNYRNIYDNNTIIIKNSYTNGHNDTIQSYLDNSLIIKNNYLEQNNTKTENAQGIYCTTLSGTFEVYNNIVYAPNSYNSLICLYIPSPSFHAIVLSNTLIGSKWGSIRVEGDNNAIIKNNIAWKYNGGLPILYEGNMTEVKNNLFYVDPMLDENFFPREGSPALNAGVMLPSPYDTDRIQTRRPQGAGFDIGAYEQVLQDQTPSPPTNLKIQFH